MNVDPGPLNFPFPDQLPAEADDSGGGSGAGDGFDRPDPEEPEEPDEPDEDEMVTAALDYEAQQRLWFRAIVPLIQHRATDTDPSPRVQLAFDLMYVAAAERVCRIMHSDLPAAQSPDREGPAG